MMEQYQDGSFGEVSPLKEKLKELTEKNFDGVKALHVGTPEELAQVREQAAIVPRVEKLEQKLNALLAELGRGDKTEILVVDKVPGKQP